MRTRPASTCASATRFAQVALVSAGLWCGVATDEVHADLVVSNLPSGVSFQDLGGGNYRIIAPDGSIIDYSEFNIFNGQSAIFELAGGRVLNRVDQITPSIIAGLLQADGQLYLVNPAGVSFMDGAVVDVAGLYAAAGTIDSADFSNGVDNFNLTGDVTVASGAMLQGGDLFLLGNRVANHGLLESSGGVIAMIAGDNVVLSRGPGDRIMVEVDGSQLTDISTPHAGRGNPGTGGPAAVENTGTIRSNAGRIVLGAGDMVSLAFRNTGTIEAAGGEINVASVDGLLQNEGLITTSGIGNGGIITFQGPSVLNSGQLLADGGGGMVNFSSINHTYMQAGSLISAAGGGGVVFTHSFDGVTIFQDGAMIDVTGGNGLATVTGDSVVYHGEAKTGATGRAVIGGTRLDLRISIDGGNETLGFNRTSNGTGYMTRAAFEALRGTVDLSADRNIFLGTLPVDPNFTEVRLSGNDVNFDAGRRVYLNASLTGARNLTVRANSDVWIHSPFALSGSSLIEGANIFFRGETFSTAGRQVYSGDVWIGLDSVMSGSVVDFRGRLNTKSLFGPLARLRIDGNAIFGGTVGDAGPDGRLQSLAVTGNTWIDGGSIRTVEYQRFDGSTTLRADTVLESTDGGAIAFRGKLDGNHDLNALTAGQTSFGGTVGGREALGSITTDAAGRTLIAANMAAADMTFADAVRLGADVQLAADAGVEFGSTVRGFDHDLLVDATTTTFNDDVTRIGALETDARGTTEINASQVRAQSIKFGDDVVVGTDTFIEGVDFVDFGQKLNGGHDVHVMSDRLIHFGEDVGGDEALASLRMDSGGNDVLDDNVIVSDGNLIRAVGDILINPGGKVDPAMVATLAGEGALTLESLEGNIFAGPNEKITALGDLKFRALNGSLTVGDLNALGSIRADAKEIFIRTRQPSRIFDFNGNTLIDFGTDIIAVGSISANVSPTLIGNGPRPFVASATGNGVADQFLRLVLRSIVGLKAQNFRLNPILDLSVPGLSLSGIEPAYKSPLELEDRVTRDPFAVSDLSNVGLSLRAMSDDELVRTATGSHHHLDVAPTAAGTSTHRLRRESVHGVVDRYSRIFLSSIDTGELLPGPRQGEIRGALTTAWDDYVSVAADEATPAGFREYLGQSESEEHAETLVYLNELEGLFRELWTMGTTPYEFQICVDEVLREIVPAGMNQSELEQCIGADQIG